MNPIREWKQRLATVSRLWGAKKYDEALAEVESLREAWPGNAHLLVLWAGLVQLQENPEASLDDAKRALQQAVELDKGSPAAAIELGYFLDQVDDDPRAAVKVYAEGVAAARKLLIDGLIGQAKAYRQLNKREDALRCLREVLQVSHFDGDRNHIRATEPGADVIFELLAGSV